MTALIDFPDAKDLAHTQRCSASGTQLPLGQRGPGPQRSSAEGNSTSTVQTTSDAQILRDGGTNFDSGQLTRDTQGATAAVEPNFTDGQYRSETQARRAVSEPTSTGGQASRATHAVTAPGGFLRDPILGVLADVVDDLETVRIANANRVRILTRAESDSDGEDRGHGLTEDHPEVRNLIATVEILKTAEHDAILNLQRSLRKHPLIAFQKRHKGIGEKQLARLLATIGDPYWNDLHNRPRTVSELWAYCGFHVVSGNAPRRTRGAKSNWSEDARKRTWVIASAMPKFAGGLYEQVYRDAREKYTEATHPGECVRCGPAKKPALPGSPLSDGHKHARAVRITAKTILRDLWIESRDIYESRTV